MEAAGDRLFYLIRVLDTGDHSKLGILEVQHHIPTDHLYRLMTPVQIIPDATLGADIIQYHKNERTNCPQMVYYEERDLSAFPLH